MTPEECEASYQEWLVTKKEGDEPCLPVLCALIVAKKNEEATQTKVHRCCGTCRAFAPMGNCGYGFCDNPNTANYGEYQFIHATDDCFLYQH